MVVFKNKIIVKNGPKIKFLTFLMVITGCKNVCVAAQSEKSKIFREMAKIKGLTFQRAMIVLFKIILA